MSVMLALVGDRLVATQNRKFWVAKRLAIPRARRIKLYEAIVLLSDVRRYTLPFNLQGVVGGKRVAFSPVIAGEKTVGRLQELADSEHLPADLLGAAQREEEGESRQKGTDEVSSQSDNPSDDAEMHGGDGNSGEVGAPAQSSSEEQRSGSSEQAADLQPADLSKAGEGKEQPKPEPENRAERLREQYAGKAYLCPWQQGKDTLCGGGNGAVIAQAVVPVSAGVAIQLRSALKRLFKGWSSDAGEDTGGQMTSPRIDGASLVKEMMSRRWALSRMRREELEPQPRTILVAADVSGSCSASSGHTVGVCQALTAVWPELLFVTHANGWVATVTQAGVTTDYCCSDTRAPRIAELVKGHKILGVLLFGDADGLSELEPVWRDERCQVVWLDSYCASFGVVRRGNYRKLYDTDSVDTAGDPLFYTGVGDSESAAVAIRLALRA